MMLEVSTVIDGALHDSSAHGAGGPEHQDGLLVVGHAYVSLKAGPMTQCWLVSML
jgi:hypothetical protein